MSPQAPDVGQRHSEKMGAESNMSVDENRTISPTATGIPLFDFNWNDFGHFDDINQSLDILNQTDDVNAQLDLLMNMNYLSNLESGSPAGNSTEVEGLSSEGGAAALCPPNIFLRIPTSDDIPIRGIHSGPPPTKVSWKRLKEATWYMHSDEVERLVNPTIQFMGTFLMCRATNLEDLGCPRWE
jgi:hypothetical protein